MSPATTTAGEGRARAVATDGSVLSGARLRTWRWAAVATAVLGLALDQITKALAVTRLDPADPPGYLGGLLHLQLLRNSGAAFSMGSGATVVISLFAAAALVVVAVVVLPRARHRWSLVACGMLLAGVSGNLTDRLLRAPGVLRGHVVDFFALPHFAVFNVADILITATAVLVIAMSFFGGDSASGERPQGSGGADDGREGSR